MLSSVPDGLIGFGIILVILIWGFLVYCFASVAYQFLKALYNHFFKKGVKEFDRPH